MTRTPPAVRILPMDRKREFPECGNVQELQTKFFLKELPRRPNGTYRYRKAGLKAAQGTVVLFQCESKVIASATLTKAERFPKPDKDGYKGALYFDISSIRTFVPVSTDTLSRIWPNAKRLSHAKLELDSNGYAAFESELKAVETPDFQE